MKLSATKAWRHRFVAAAALGLLGITALYAQPAPDAAAYAADPALLLDGFRHVEVASVADAIEQLNGQRRYMSHRMRPIFPSKFAGFAVTVKMTKAETKDGAKASAPMLEAIDKAPKNSVYVMQVEGGDDIAGMGGLMGTAMNARGFAGAVIDGGVRDVGYLIKMQFPVFSTGIVPSTLVGHYKAQRDVPVLVDGQRVAPGDVIVADYDGVVVVPREQAPQILIKAQALDQAEHSMYGIIEKLRSIEDAVAQFGRI